MPDYRTIITTLGQAKIAAAIASSTPLVLTTMYVGDSNGVGYDPIESQTALVHSVYSDTLDSVELLSGGVIVCTMNIPISSGGYYIREAGIYDSTGALIAVVRIADRYKPLPGSGQADDLTIVLKLDVGNVGAVTWSIDPLNKTPISKLLRTPWLPVLSMTTTAPPGTPNAGDIYVIPPSGASGAWTGHANKLAEWTGLAWAIINAPDGHGVGLTNGRVFIKISGLYVELIDPIFRARVEDADIPIDGWQSAPPGSPVNGSRYVIKATATGAWAGLELNIAMRVNGAWQYLAPRVGLVATFVEAGVPKAIYYNNGAWQEWLPLATASELWTGAGGSKVATPATVKSALGSAHLAAKGYQSAPPGSPAAGDIYVIKPTATGAWTGQDLWLAAYLNGGWVVTPPIVGMVVTYFDGADFRAIRYTSGAWTDWLGTTTAAGPLEIALGAEVVPGADTARAVTPAVLKEAGFLRGSIAVNGYQSAPPGSPVVGDIYVIKPTATGAWAAQDLWFAVYTTTGWVVRPPIVGQVATYIDGTDFRAIRYYSGAWNDWQGTLTAAGPLEIALGEEIFPGNDNTRAVTAAGLNAAGYRRKHLVVDGWLSAPPGSPAAGDTYIIKPTATGAWVGLELNIASYIGGAWRYIGPVNGLVASYMVGAVLTTLYYTSGAWQVWSDPGRLLNIQKITATGTYTPTAGTNRIIVEATGGGGGGGGTPNHGAYSAGGGGSAAAYAKAMYTSGFSGGVACTIGAAGVGGAGGGNGGNGGTTSFGALLSCPGGNGGQYDWGHDPIVVPAYGLPSGPPSGSGIILGFSGAVGSSDAFILTASNLAIAGHGANGLLGAGGGVLSPATAEGYGTGGGGRNSPPSTAAQPGGSGGPGVIIIYEYS